MKLFFDTETTGKADFRAPPDAPHQPRLVQLGALLTDDDGNEVSSVNLIIKPDGFEIPDGAASVHGITTQTAIERGIAIEAVLPVFAQLVSRADIVIAHNIEFDTFVMTGEFLRRDYDETPFDGAAFFCTMRAMTPICKLPNMNGYSDFKWPKLQEAHKHCFGVEFESAHDAMADVRACARVYFWLQKQQAQPAPITTNEKQTV
jgi:DNA polymerase III subunit epsilon